MRSREEIEKLLYQEQKSSLYKDGALLEVLLDIRDLLNKHEER